MPMPRKIDPVKHCAQCGVLMERMRYNGTLESLHAFRRRKYCSLTCVGLSQRKEEIGKSGYQHRARRFRGERCEACGTKYSLQAHHIDQDYTNNTAENIQTLCKTCHDFWHATATRNRWAIAGRMPRLTDSRSFSRPPKATRSTPGSRPV